MIVVCRLIYCYQNHLSPRTQGISILLISCSLIRYVYNRWQYCFLSKQFLEIKMEMYMKIFLSEAVALLAVEKSRIRKEQICTSG